MTVFTENASFSGTLPLPYCVMRHYYQPPFCARQQIGKALFIAVLNDSIFRLCYLDLIAPAQEEYIRKCTDGLTASAAHWAVNHQETWPYGLRNFTLGVVSSWDLDDVMDSKSYEEMPQKYGGSFDQAVERARRTALYLAAKQLDVIGPEEYGTERLRRALRKSAPLEGLDADLLRGSVQRITIRKCRASPSLKNGKRSRRCSLFAERVKST